MKLTGRGEKRDITLTNKFMAHGSTDLVMFMVEIGRFDGRDA